MFSDMSVLGIWRWPSSGILLTWLCGDVHFNDMSTGFNFLPACLIFKCSHLAQAVFSLLHFGCFWIFSLDSFTSTSAPNYPVAGVTVDLWTRDLKSESPNWPVPVDRLVISQSPMLRKYTSAILGRGTQVEDLKNSVNHISCNDMISSAHKQGVNSAWYILAQFRIICMHGCMFSRQCILAVVVVRFDISWEKEHTLSQALLIFGRICKSTNSFNSLLWVSQLINDTHIWHVTLLHY